MEFATKAIHVGEEPDLKDGSGDVVVPIHLASTFARREVEKPTKGYEYSRTGNPTRKALEKRLAALEKAKFGLAFSSGMAAETTLALTLLKAKNHVIVVDDLYGGTKRLFEKVFRKNFGINFSYVDATKVEEVEGKINKNTRLIWLESPTNPLMKLCDIKKISEIAKDNEIVTVVDNTFMSPYFQKPLELGADISLHSTTKYLNGHSDSVGGAIMTSNKKIYESLKFNQNAAGAILSPFDSFLVLRGTKTLAVRMEKHEKNAIKVAHFLAQHEKVKKVNYPGLKEHSQHELAKKQMLGFGGMLSFEIKGKLKEAKKFLESLKIFALAESLGGVESLAEHPALMTHASLTKKEREKRGISASLIRLSVGIEHSKDLLADLKKALDKI